MKNLLLRASLERTPSIPKIFTMETLKPYKTIWLISTGNVSILCVQMTMVLFFTELVRLTVLQVSIVHCPRKKIPLINVPCSKNRSALHRKRQKLKAKLQCLEFHLPNSPSIPHIRNELSLLQIEIRDLIVGELEGQEKRAISVIKTTLDTFLAMQRNLAGLKVMLGHWKTTLVPSTKTPVLRLKYYKTNTVQSSATWIPKMSFLTQMD